MIGLGVLGLRPGLPYVLLVQFSGLIGELAGQELTERRGDYETILQHSLGVVLFLVDSKCLQWGADIVRTAPSFPRFLPGHCCHHSAL